MKKSNIAVTIIRCATAVICCVAVAITSFSIFDKIRANEAEVAKLVNNAADDGALMQSDENYQSDSFSESETYDEVISDTETGFVESVGDNQATEDVAQPDSDKSVLTDKKITVTSGLDSTDKAEVLEYYRMVMDKNEKDGLGHNQALTLEKLDGGSGPVGKFISWFEGVAKKALADNSMSHEGLPGVHDKIRVTDFASAKAVNDGRYTTVTINLVEQTDGAYGKLNEGTVGRSVGVLDGIAVAVAAIKGLEVDFDTGEVYLRYKNPQIVIKVDNKTGSLVKGACSWKYKVHVDIKKLDVSMMGISLTLNGAYGVVDMVCSY